MHIIVCIKSVVTKAPEGQILRSLDLCELNPFDRPALEMAFILRKECGGAVTALSMGPQSSEPALYEALAMGADRAVLLSDPCLSGCDTLATSAALSAAIEKLKPFDLLLFGTRSSDSDTGQVGPQTAVMLNIPFVTNVHSLKLKNGALETTRKCDGFRETFEVLPPAGLTIHPQALAVGDVSLGGIQNAFSQAHIEKMALTDTCLLPEAVGESGSGTRMLSMQRLKRERKCRFIKGTEEEQANELVNFLKDSGLIG